MNVSKGTYHTPHCLANRPQSAATHPIGLSELASQPPGEGQKVVVLQTALSQQVVSHEAPSVHAQPTGRLLDAHSAVHTYPPNQLELTQVAQHTDIAAHVPFVNPGTAS